ncbi:hypothetical protein D3C87_2053400 [compost metagenome]
MIVYGLLLDRIPSGLLLLISGFAIVLVALLGRRGLKNGRELEVMQNREPLPELHA